MTIIRNIRIVLLRTTPLEYLNWRGCPEIQKKVKRIKKLNRKIKEVTIEKLTKIPCSKTNYLYSLQGFLDYTRKLDSIVRYRKKLVRRIRKTGSTGCIIRKRLYFIILLSAIIDY